MSSADPTPPANSKPSSGSQGEEVAVSYVGEQLAKARKSLRGTRLICTVLILLVLGYMSFLTVALKKEHLDPKPAAEMATLQLSTMIQDNGPLIASRLKEEIPSFIAQFPDYVLRQLPVFREDLEKRLEGVFSDYCRTTSQGLEGHVDKFFSENKDAIKEFLDSSQDEKSMHELGESLEDQLQAYLGEKAGDGESVQEKLDKSLEMLDKIQARLHRLSIAKDLTTEERQLRHAIAVIMHAAGKEVAPIVKEVSPIEK